ncbi:universal stress protein [Actinoplanes sp. NPDC020271]|uniref:universal stress protein n=1 Tax=Actinoplanes sp. NPDC020271 TaxID=3363896 RepID=UPI0037B52D73
MNRAFASEDHHTVVVGVDGTPACSATVELAAAEAARRAARLLIVHVWPGNYRGRFRVHDGHRTEVEGLRLLAAAAGFAAATDPALVVETALRAGSAGEALAECSRAAGLLVVGHRDSQLTRSDWGSTTRLLASHCACPLMVHRGRHDARGPVVVGVSGRPGAPALGYAFTQAAATGTTLVAVHAWHRPPDRQTPHPIPVGEGGPERRAAAEMLATAVIGWQWRFPQVTADTLVIPEMDATYTLNRASRRGRLLVAGAGGRGELTELVGTPPAHPSGRHGLCPVLLVPPGWPVQAPPVGASTAQLTD